MHKEIASGVMAGTGHSVIRTHIPFTPEEIVPERIGPTITPDVISSRWYCTYRGNTNVNRIIIFQIKIPIKRAAIEIEIRYRR